MKWHKRRSSKQGAKFERSLPARVVVVASVDGRRPAQSGTLEGPPIAVVPGVSVVPVVGWRTLPGVVGAAGVTCELLGVLVATETGVTWSPAGPGRQDYPSAEMSPPPPEPVGEMMARVIEVDHQDGSLRIALRVTTPPNAPSTSGLVVDGTGVVKPL